MGQLHGGWRLIMRSAPLAIGIVLVSAAPAAAAATSTVMPSTAVGTSSGFFDTDAVSATDGWAVGGTGNGLIERWNGSRWSVVPSPDLIDDKSNPNNWASLASVDATSASNAFAVGTSTKFVSGSSVNAAVAERWNGSSWSRMAVPNPAGTSYSLAAMKAFSASDVWAVGQSTTGVTTRMTLAMHFNGTAWSSVPTPSPSTRDNVLQAIGGSSTNDVWAVGYFKEPRYGSRARHPLVLHWNGSAWSQVASPEIAGAQQNVLNDVVAFSPTDAWAVGYSNGPFAALVEHWDGTSWTAVSAPNLELISVMAAQSPTDITVAGSDFDGQPQIANWRGSGWTVSPLPATGGDSLHAMTAVAPNTVWTVGSSFDATTSQNRPLAIRTTG